MSSMQPICVVGSPHVSMMAMARSESVAESVCIEGAGDYAVLLCVACVAMNGAVVPTYLPQPHLSANPKSHSHHVQICSHV